VLPPDGILTSGAMPVAARQEVWQLMAPVVLPGHLDHDALLVPHDGGGTLRAQTSLRWAEPLRDVVPRLLRTAACSSRVREATMSFASAPTENSSHCTFPDWTGRAISPSTPVDAVST
jgi:hypothetical protein